MFYFSIRQLKEVALGGILLNEGYFSFIRLQCDWVKNLIEQQGNHIIPYALNVVNMHLNTFVSCNIDSSITDFPKFHLFLWSGFHRYMFYLDHSIK